jgi:hypothetical protein
MKSETTRSVRLGRLQLTLMRWRKPMTFRWRFWATKRGRWMHLGWRRASIGAWLR